MAPDLAQPSQLQPLDQVKHLIHHGDLLLFRGHPIRTLDHLIMTAGRSSYVHAAMTAWDNDGLNMLEMMQFVGGRQVSLADRVALKPGACDVYTIDRTRFPDLDRVAAVNRMRELISHKYGWWNLFRVGLRHIAFIRLAIPPLVDDEANGSHPPFCSQAVADAYRRAGVDPVPNLADRVTEPGDLARSLLFRYQFTLT